MRNGLEAYKQNKFSGIQEASPIKLITMLMDESIACLDSAAIACDNGRTALKLKSIQHAMNIVSNGLYAALDFEKGGQVAKSLGDSYQLILAKLLAANIANDADGIRECSILIGTLRDGWRAAEALDGK